jgi:hypothetical protein
MAEPAITIHPVRVGCHDYECLWYAPLALSFLYAKTEIEFQLLAVGTHEDRVYLDRKATVVVIHLAWICKMTSECIKYAFSTLSEVVIQDLRVVIRDLQVVIRDLQRKMFGL